MREAVLSVLHGTVCLVVLVSLALASGPNLAAEKIQIERQASEKYTTPPASYWTTVPDGSDTTSYDEWRDRVPPDDELSRPVLIYGVVVLEDGSPPLEPIGLERICEGTVLPEGTTDLGGRFTLQPGWATARETDAAWSTPLGPRLGQFRWACELRAVYPGYRSDSVQLGDRAPGANLDVGELVLHRLDEVHGATLSSTNAEASPRARRAYAAGIEEASRGNLQQALKQFVKATRLTPSFAAAWNRRGHAHHTLGDSGAARASWIRAIESDPDYLLPCHALALLDLAEENWEGVTRWTGLLVERAAIEFPGAAYLSAVAHLQLGRLELAEASARRSVELGWSDRDPRAQLLLGVILDRLGRRKEAAVALRAYVDRVPDAAGVEFVRTSLARLEADR